MKKILLILFLGFGITGSSQPPVSWTSAEIYQGLRKLKVLGTVLYVAAHPDDENNRLITYLSKEKLLRTGYLSVTRGDGGQNLIGTEQGIELGLIRTQELLAARRIDGGEQFFTRAFDFGYSKTASETFAKWDKEKILSDVVWVIRNFQPDVIVTRFPVTGEGGHGHHTASGILANEAFEAAADPSRFPEQLKHVQPWKAKRVLWNTFNFGGTNSTREDQFKIDVGGYNPLLGKSYGEIAAESRSQHKSQGFGVTLDRGEALEYFKATKGDQPVQDLMDGVITGWKRVNGANTIEQIIDSLLSGFDFFHPERSVKGLVKLYSAVAALPEGNWRNAKLMEVKELLLQCSGLFIDATSAEQYLVQSDSARMNFSLNNRLGTNAKLVRLSINGFDSSFTKNLERNRNFNFSKTILVPGSHPVSQPYWLVEDMAEGYHNVSDQLLIGKPNAEPSYQATFTIELEGLAFEIVKPVKYKFRDPVRGEVYSPVTVIPPFSLRLTPDFVLLDKDNKYEYDQVVTSYRNNNNIRFGSQENNKAKPVSVTLGRETSNFLVADKHIDTKDSDTVKFYDLNTNQPAYDLISIRHDHIPAINYFKKAELVILDFEYQTYGKKIAFIPGAGDKIPEALEQMGYEVNIISAKEMSRNKLDKFDAIITGVRAYNTNEWLNKHYDKLMKYVHEGGNLIVQYNTSSNLGPVKAKIGPYNFNISRTRITDENSPVQFLNPGHPVLNFPNKITENDFKGWIQERSIYHATGWDSSKFETVIAFRDPGENPEPGSLVIAKYGKGTFTYTGLVFFRQLPAGVAGAYRLLANLIALNRKKAF